MDTTTVFLDLRLTSHREWSDSDQAWRDAIAAEAMLARMVTLGR